MKSSFRFSFLSFYFILLIACQPQSTKIPTAAFAPSIAPQPTEAGTNAVELLVYSNDDRVFAGTTTLLKLSFRPIIFRVTRKSDGSILSTSRALWNSPSIAEMQWCQSFNTRCELTGNWVPFKEEQETKIQVDWSGARAFWVAAQFRDANGMIIPAMDRDRPDSPNEVARYSIQIVGVVDERTPFAFLPAPVQTSVAATRAVFPVTGFIRMENGRCCAGGKAGTTIQVKVEFGATSPFGEVKEMRVNDFRTRKCATETEMNQVAWEPLVAEKIYRVSVTLNWASFDVSAQYRDAKGNLSPIYCADLAVEGMP